MLDFMNEHSRVMPFNKLIYNFDLLNGHVKTGLERNMRTTLKITR